MNNRGYSRIRLFNARRSPPPSYGYKHSKSPSYNHNRSSSHSYRRPASSSSYNHNRSPSLLYKNKKSKKKRANSYKRTSKSGKKKIIIGSSLITISLLTVFGGFSILNLDENNPVVTNELQFPIRGTFYYAWYPDNWDPHGYHVTLNPTAGYYDSNDRDVINQHITEMEYGHIDVAIASWWGLDKENRILRDKAIKKCLEETDIRAANGDTDLLWTIYYEREVFADESPTVLREYLDYLKSRYVDPHDCYAHIDGKPLIFVWSSGSEDNDDEFTNRWAEAVGDDWYYVLKIFSSYEDVARQPSSWHQYGPATRIHRVKDSSGTYVSYNISPGFDHSDPGHDKFLARATRQVWTETVTEMVNSGVEWQLITSYNEWGEGTSVESAQDWMSETGYGMYLDVLHEIF